MLTPAEERVARLLVEGLDHAEISVITHWGIPAVNRLVMKIRRKLGCEGHDAKTEDAAREYLERRDHETSEEPVEQRVGPADATVGAAGVRSVQL